MRKDIKLGLAIGAVVIAVAIVFVLVNSHKPTDVAQNDDNNVEQTDSTDVGPVDANKTATDSAKPTDAQAKIDKPAATGTTGDAARIDSTGKPALAGAGTTSHSDSADNKLASEPKNDSVPTTMTPAPGAAAGGGVQTDPWPSLLSDGVVPPVAAAVQSTPRPGARISTAGQAANGGVVDPSDNDQDGSNHTAMANVAIVQTHTNLIDPAARSGASTHSIQSGETFSTIAAARYGNARYYKLIQQANPGVDSSHLTIGQVINLPAAPARATVASPATVAERAIDGSKQYRVQAGDNLHRICIRLYGDPKLVAALYELNKGQIGSDMAKLKLGMVLTLPQAPTASVGR